jgi:hypothetical protein
MICAGVASGWPKAMLAPMVLEKRKLSWKHEPDVAAQVVEVQPARVDAVEQQAAGRRIEEARDEAHQDALARTGGAEDRDALAGFHVEVDVVQHRLGPVRCR